MNGADKPYTTNHDRYEKNNGTSYFIYKYEDKSSKGYLGDGNLKNEKVTLGDIREYVENSDVYLNNQDELEKKNEELNKKNQELEEKNQQLAEKNDELEEVKASNINLQKSLSDKNFYYEEKLKEYQELLERLLEFSKKADYYYDKDNKKEEYEVYIADPNNSNKLNVLPQANRGALSFGNYYFNYRIVNNNNEKINIRDLNTSNLISLKDAKIVIEATKIS